MMNGEHGALAGFEKISDGSARDRIRSRGVSTQPARTIKDGVESRAPANPLFLRDEELRQGIELMFYAYRDFTFESDQQLRRYQLGRAHHRALYFIGRHPGQTVGHLLSILKVTKQSISRVLKDLIEQGYVEQKSGARDRRERLLWLSPKGQELERDLTDRQSQRFARAYRETGAEAVEGFRKVLLGLLDPAERQVVDKRLRGGGR
jgi:DNA-binding MarR family transcriptional regulator